MRKRAIHTPELDDAAAKPLPAQALMPGAAPKRINAAPAERQ
jgi:hypothetical protein